MQKIEQTKHVYTSNFRYKTASNRNHNINRREYTEKYKKSMYQMREETNRIPVSESEWCKCVKHCIRKLIAPRKKGKTIRQMKMSIESRK